MKRWLFILALIGVFYLLSALNKKRLQNKFPFLKRIDYTLTILAWVLLATYVGVFIFWLYKMLFN